LLKRLLVAVFAGFTLLAAAPAKATTFTLDDYDVTLRAVDPGLVLWEKDILAPPTSFDLNNTGDSFSAALFQIGTNEKALNFDDVGQYPIEVNFSFSSPPPGFGGGADGITGAAWFGTSFGYALFDSPLVLSFGSTGLLGITLSNVVFGLPGSAVVNATFSLVRQDVRSTPEPATPLLMGLGAAGTAVQAFRRRRKHGEFV
jgi:hypothetical protein